MNKVEVQDVWNSSSLAFIGFKYNMPGLKSVIIVIVKFKIVVPMTVYK